MKKIAYLLSFSIIFSFILFASCGGGGDDDDPQLTPEQEQTKTLSGTWSQSSTDNLPDGVDPTILDDLSLTYSSSSELAPTSFSASGAPDFFSSTSNSTWGYGGSVDVINLTGVSPITSLSITSLSANSLRISFTHPGLRVAGLDGTYSVTLTK